MEKTLRDTILKKTVEDLSLPEDIVEKVVSWSYKNANEASKVNNEVEMSGLGVFKVSNAKLKRRIIRLEELIGNIKRKIEEGRSKNIENDYEKIESCTERLNYCKSKLKDEDRTK